MEPMSVLRVSGFIALGVALFLLFTLVVMRLWNWLVPSLFNGPRLRFVQAMGLVFLTRLLFGGFGGWGGKYWRGGNGNSNRQHFHHYNNGPQQKLNTDTTVLYRQ